MDNSPDINAARLAAPRQSPHEVEASAYGASFWLCYAGNCLLMVAVSVLFRYADFVRYLGGGELQLGLIVGVGMIGALLVRVVQGVGIDHYGSRAVWLLSLVLFIISMGLHLLIDNAFGPSIFLVRILMTTSIAGAFGASITYISLRVPETRIAEMVGTLGTSGFLGMALGPTFGDWLFGLGPVTQLQINRMFWTAIAAGVASLGCTLLATRGHTRRPPRRRPSLVALVRRYHPGTVLLVAAAMGAGITLPHTFLRAYTAELQIAGIKNFFLVYAFTAFVVRIATRRLTARIGIRPVVLMGLVSLSASMLLYLPVRTAADLAWPAILAGTAHAFLFPAVVAGGSLSFPARYRGLATTLVLAMFDLGSLVGQPAVGALVRVSRHLGWPAYPTMFCCVTASLASVAVVFAIQSRPRRRAASTDNAAASSPAQPARELTKC